MRDNQRRRRKHGVSVDDGAPAWMVTYADMITLVLAFFVLLFSFAAVDQAKFNELLSSIRVSFTGSEGILPGSVEPGEQPNSFLENDKLEDIAVTVAKVQKFVADNNLEGTVTLLVDSRGVVLEISDVLLFDPAKDELKPEAQEILQLITELLSTLDNNVIVEGHTDNIPINTSRFPSNWELSVARAVVVVRYLAEITQLSPTRFAAIGYGEFHPIDSNLTLSGRAKNRRVNIVITSSKNADEEVP